jgi:hypothetical protein
VTQVFSTGDDDEAHGDTGLTLADAFARLPQAWTVLRDRRLGGQVIDAVLVHPKRGLALVGLGPLALEAAAALRERLDGEHFAEFFPGTLPIVALDIAPVKIFEIERRLDGAFQGAPTLAITDGDWADAVVDLLLASDEPDLTTGAGSSTDLPAPFPSAQSAGQEIERTAALPEFPGSRSLASRADLDTLPPPPPMAPRRRDWLMPAVCAVVFTAELSVACGILDAPRLLSFSMPAGVEGHNTSPRLLEAVLKPEEPWGPAPATAPEVPPDLLTAEPLIGVSVEPPTPVAPATDDAMKSKSGEVLKVATSLRQRLNTSRPTRRRDGGVRQVHNGRGRYALAEQLYEPGRRPPGW